MLETDGLTLKSIVLFEAKAVRSACLTSCVVNTEIHSSELKYFWQGV